MPRSSATPAMNPDSPKAAGLQGSIARTYGSLLFSGAAMAFVGAVALYSLFGPSNIGFVSSLAVVAYYSLAGLSAILALAGAVYSLRLRKGGSFAMSSEGVTRLTRLAYSALAGLSLTLASFFYIGGIGFENQETGFPLLFSFRTAINTLGPLNFQLIPALVDFGFWLAVGYLFLSGVPFGSRIIRGSFEGLVGVSIGLFFSLMVLGVVYQSYGVSGWELAPLFFLLNLPIGYIQIRRGFRVMGLAILVTGFFLAALVAMQA